MYTTPTAAACELTLATCFRALRWLELTPALSRYSTGQALGKGSVASCFMNNFEFLAGSTCTSHENSVGMQPWAEDLQKLLPRSSCYTRKATQNHYGNFLQAT
jgi:hypothetical protein